MAQKSIAFSKAPFQEVSLGKPQGEPWFPIRFPSARLLGRRPGLAYSDYGLMQLIAGWPLLQRQAPQYPGPLIHAST